MPSTDIIVLKRADDYRAFLSDNENVWEAGKTRAEAIGKLVISARSLLGIAIIDETSPNVKKKRKR
jgi:hypothetical protein